MTSSPTPALPAPLLAVPAPAKLNLFLHITGRLSNGYHQLQSVFVLVDWQDFIDFTPNATGRITRTQRGGAPLPDDDLCTRAARALQQATGCPLGVQIHIEKNIPAEAGMGGGSSDAATCLLALNRLWNLRLSHEQLAAIGLQLGADVPFFLFGRNAWVEGIGEQLRPVALPAARWLVVKPPRGASTAQIFSSPDLVRSTAPATIADFAASGQPLQFGHNDLQAVAQTICADIGQCLEWMRSCGFQPRMTGSGSAVFALIPPEIPDAAVLQHIARHQAPESWHIRICRQLDAHPLLESRA